MDKPFIFKALLTSIVILFLPAFLSASSISTDVTPLLKNKSSINTPGDQEQEEKQEKNKKKPDVKSDGERTDIREVPKARRQFRPPVVVKPTVRAKPVKIIRPKIKRL